MHDQLSVVSLYPKSIGSNSDSTKVPPSKTPPASGTEMPTFTPLGGAGPATPLQQSPLDPAISVQLSFDPVATLPARLVKRILDLDFVEMSDMLPDAWQEDSNPGTDPLSSSRRVVRRAPITEITLWLEGFGRLASVLTSRYPSKAAEMWAYQSSIIRAARNFDGTAWVAYDRQFRREALARRDLNWSATNARLYSEAFTGRAKVIPRCRHCLSETHDLRACPVNPDNLDPTARRQSSPGASSKDVCRNYNDGKCRYSRCKYQHVCRECHYPHPWSSCPKNTRREDREGRDRSRPPRS